MQPPNPVDSQSLSAAGFGSQCESCPLHLPAPIKAGSADLIAVDKHRAELVIAQIRHVEAKKTECRAIDTFLVSPTHDIERACHEVDDRCAGNTPLGVNRMGFERVEIVPRNRAAKRSRGELRARIRVKRVYRIVHCGDEDDVMHPAGNIDPRAVKRRALDLTIDTHHEPPMELVRTGDDICGSKDGFARNCARAECVIASLEHIDSCPCLRA
jgi:hypothetical protein